MKILLVDDSSHALNRLKECVSEAVPDGQIIAFSNPLEAIDSKEAADADVAFLDIEVGYGINGIVLAKKLKEINRKIKIIFCTAYSKYALDAFSAHASGYILKPVSTQSVKSEIEALELEDSKPTKAITIHTFGNFEIFFNGQPIRFERSRAKEVIAILVDYNGAVVRTEQIADRLWSDGMFDVSRKKQLYTIIASLKKTFDSLGFGGVLIKGTNGYAINRELVDCDYFRLMDGDVSVINSYQGTYMYGYDWAEFYLPNSIERLKN